MSAFLNSLLLSKDLNAEGGDVVQAWGHKPDGTIWPMWGSLGRNQNLKNQIGIPATQARMHMPTRLQKHQTKQPLMRLYFGKAEAGNAGISLHKQHGYCRIAAEGDGKNE